MTVLPGLCNKEGDSGPGQGKGFSARGNDITAIDWLLLSARLRVEASYRICWGLKDNRKNKKY